MPNHPRSMEFMSDALYAGVRLKTFSVLDEGAREALTVIIDTWIASGRVIRELGKLVEVHGRPAAIRCDNGREFCEQAFVGWYDENGIEIRCNQPGKPNQNAFIERLNKSYLD